MNLNSFDVQPTTRRPTVITRRPLRRSSTTLLPSVIQNTPIIDVTTNRTGCRVDDEGESLIDVTSKHDDVNNSTDDFRTIQPNRADNSNPIVSPPATKTENNTTASSDDHVQRLPLNGSLIVTSLVTSSSRITGVDDFDDESDEDELDEDSPTEQKLMDRLMRHYEKSVRPVRNASDTVLVRMGLTLTQIFNMVGMTTVVIVISSLL